jgi:hypothetical protein
LKNRILYFIIISVFCAACEKELNITDFRDEFGNYQPELKIEGILKLDKPEDSIIRVIKTSVITDRDLYDGIDNDGDGEIDEYEEIIAHVQDTSAIVKVVNLNSGDEIDFVYTSFADRSIYYQKNEDEEETLTYVTYGGYKPADPGFRLEAYDQYQLELYSTDFDQTVTAITTVYPAVDYIDTLHVVQDSIVIIDASEKKEIFWKSDLNVTSYFITLEEVLKPGGHDWENSYISSFTTVRDNDLTETYNNASIGRLFLFGGNFSAILKVTVESLSPELGRYILSSLPLKDPQRTNLRDSDGNPVMGCFGSSAAKSRYVVIQN